MGRKFRISSAEKEKEKIRNSILEVFRARLRSPGGGGAIVVGQNNTETDKRHTLHKATNEELGGDTSSSSMSDRDACPNLKYNQKKKRRRVKSKTKHTKKVKKEKADITRNLKMVNNIRTALNPGGSREDGMRKISVITHNRLTNKLGLFNPGRKSETISREISVSETVKHKAEEDLKTILSHDNNYGGEDENHPMDLHHNSPPPRQLNLTYAGSNTCTKKDIGYFSRGSSHSVVTPLPSQSVMTGSVSCVSVASIESDDGLHSLPKTPPYEETAAFLISALRPKQFFPERNLFQETIEELQTVMRKSTPLSATPTYCNFVKQRIASGSVKRSLLDRYPPSASTTTSEDISMQVEERSTSKHKHNLKLSNPAKPSTLSKSDTENDRNKETIIEINDTEWSGNCHDVEHGTSKPESLNMNNKSKTHDTLNLKVETKCREKQIRHKYTDILYSDYKKETKSKETNPEKSYNTLSRTETNNDGRSLLKSNDGAAVDNGRSLLQCNDEAAMINMSVDTTVNFFGSVEEDHYKPASTDYQRHTDKLFESANKSCVNTLSHCIVPMDTHNHYHGIYVSSNHSSQSSGYQGSQSTNVLVFPGQRSSSSMNEGIKSNLAVITKFREHPEYMPTFHSGMYTSDRDIHTYGRLDTLTSAEIKSMDMLDLLDHDCIEQLPERRTTVPRLKSTTPDSDGSPLWLPPDHLLQPPAKPSLENLSPPKKLYPRRLY